MILLIVFVFLLAVFNFATIYFLGVPLSPIAITGKVVETAYVRVLVGSFPRIITIYTPENTTYDNGTYTCSGDGFPKCDNYRYLLPLNVSANFFVENESNWKYSLYDLRHNEYVWEDIVFAPNTSVPFVRWGNLLTVFAEEEDADWVSQNVTFTIDVPNSAPLISGFTKKMFVCENDRINSLTTSYFNVTDIDEDSFSAGTSRAISPADGKFAVSYLGKGENDTINRFQIRSVFFTNKADLGDHIETVSVIDPYGLSDNNVTNVTVIEVNNAPDIINELSAETNEIWINGSDSVFYHDYSVTDREVDSGSGDLTFNLTWLIGELDFDINSSTGVMNYTSVEGDQGSESQSYSLRVCVTDNALESVHENFSICSDRGYSSENFTVCDDFSLTITNRNRAPSIDSYFPIITNFTVSGTTTNLFNVTVSDDDMSEGFYPGISWYVDGVLNKENESVAFDTFSYAFGCGVSGDHSVMVVASDGIANDSVTWNISVTNVACPIPPADGDGGGGGGGSLGGICNEQWNCLGWDLCQNAERSFNAGILSPEDYASTRDICAQNQYDDRFCGFQITKCFDLAMCNNTEVRIPKPVESRVCYFTEDPNCIDGITNCHDGDCELLVDCGGPCSPCPTCSDGKRNQGEGGIDCGGPCPYACKAETPFRAISFALVGLLLLLLLILMYILYKVFKILRHRFFLKGKKRKKEDGR